MKITILLILFLSFSEFCFQSKKINTYLDFGLKYMQNGSCTQYPALLNLTLTLKNGIVYGKILFPPTFKLVNNVKLILDIANNGTCTNCINNYTPYLSIQCIYNNKNKIPFYFYPKELINSTLTVLNTCAVVSKEYNMYQIILNNYLKIINNNFAIVSSYTMLSNTVRPGGCRLIYDPIIGNGEYLYFSYII